ncbi:MAG: M23 family metallopeptidase [Treponemataceae bacterium]|nr:M23 family metallopeptidase [Treponemataceae bacterium]
MASKKRLYFLIIPAVCIYVTAVGFVIAGSASRSPSMPQKISQQDAEIDAAAQNPNSTNEIIITLSDRTRPAAKPEQTETKAEEKTSAVKTIFAKLNPNAEKNNSKTEEANSSVSAAAADLSGESAVNIAAAENSASEIDENDELPLDLATGLNGMGGADVTPQPNLGIEAPELYYTVYRLKPGDMIGTLAADYNITQDTLISVNNIKSSRTIQIGQYIRIPSIPGIVYTTRIENETPESIAEKYKVSAAKVALVNNTETTTAFSAGTTLFVPDAELDWITRQEINGDLFKRPLKRGYYISSRYSWRTNPFTARRTFHNGVDLAAPQGTPIYAALEGTVVATGWDNVYGKFVTVSHHSGYKTLYGHMSKITTKKGAYVTTSTKIGEVGSTGQSTGPHVHFTVYKNGRTINPENLWN